MADMKSVINILSKKKNEDEDQIYLYVIQPKHDYEDLNEDDDNWQGKIYHQQNFIKQKFDEINTKAQSGPTTYNPQHLNPSDLIFENVWLVLI